MTLTTKVLIHEKVNPLQIHLWVNSHLLGAADATIDIIPNGYDADDRWTMLQNRPGQGLDAWFTTKFYTDPAPYRHDELIPFDWRDYHDAERYPEDWAALGGDEHFPSGHLILEFDTVYGAGPTEVHARLIAGLNDGFLVPRGLTFAWHNEYSDVWSEGMTGFEQWFGDQDRAEDWFANLVKPTLRLITDGEEN
jgi:hypothetical protein